MSTIYGEGYVADIQSLESARHELAEMRAHGSTDDIVEAAARLARIELLAQGEQPWRTVERDGFPVGDEHATYIGINSAGYACCFNAMHGGMCFMETAEGSHLQMSDLRDWRPLDRPVSSGLNSMEVKHG